MMSDSLLAYEILGHGVPVAVPFSLGDRDLLREYARRFDGTVQLVAYEPRSYARGLIGCDFQSLGRDLDLILKDAGLHEVGIWGYSFSAPIAAVTATQSSAINAMLCGGFPLVPPYRYWRELTIRRLGRASVPLADRALLVYMKDFYTQLMDWPAVRQLASLNCRRRLYVGGADSYNRIGMRIRNSVPKLRDMGFGELLDIPGLDHIGALREVQAVADSVAAFFSGG